MIESADLPFVGFTLTPSPAITPTDPAANWLPRVQRDGESVSMDYTTPHLPSQPEASGCLGVEGGLIA
jgi:hypothetical protein